MDARNANETRNRWAMGLRTPAVVVAIGTLAAVWHPASHDATAASNDSAAVPDMPVYYPARFPAPVNVEAQAPTF